MTRTLFLAALVSVLMIAAVQAAETSDAAKPAPDAKAKEPEKVAADEPLTVLIAGNSAKIGPVPVGRKIEVQAAVNLSVPSALTIQETKGDAVKVAGPTRTVHTGDGGMPGRSPGLIIIPLEAVKPGKAEITFARNPPFVLTIEVQAADVAKPADAKPAPDAKAKEPEKAAAPGAAPAAAAPPAKRANPVPINGKGDPRAPGFIVLFEDKIDGKDVVAADEVSRLEGLYGFAHKYIYTMQGFKGFAAQMSNEIAEKLRWEPSVHSIERDGVVNADAAGGAKVAN
jgi:hypothetical protein